VQNRCRSLNGQQSVPGVDEETLQGLQRMLDALNPYVKVFRNARDIFEADDVINLSIRIIKHVLEDNTHYILRMKVQLS